MFLNVFYFLLIGAVVSSDSVEHDDSGEKKGNFGYELLHAKFDHLQHRHDKLAKHLVQVQETAERMMDRQYSMMDQLLGGILTITNISSEILKQQTPQPKRVINSCKFVSTSGKYQLQLSSKALRSVVYCDMDSFFGGWLVIQQRLDSSVNFTRTWMEYRNGFGTVGESTEYWLGLELLHQVTTSGHYELLIELKNEAGKYGYARYTEFKVGAEEDKYRISQLGEHGGTIPDDLSYHKNRRFSTVDQDNDDMKGDSCARKYFSGGGWWYSSCAYSSLNGQFTKNKEGYGINWFDWSKAATFSRMMIRH